MKPSRTNIIGVGRLYWSLVLLLATCVLASSACTKDRYAWDQPYTQATVLYAEGHDSEAVDILRRLSEEYPNEPLILATMADDLLSIAAKETDPQKRNMIYSEAASDDKRALNLFDKKVLDNPEGVHYKLTYAMLLTLTNSCLQALPVYEDIYNRKFVWSNEGYLRGTAFYATCLIAMNKSRDAAKILGRSLDTVYLPITAAPFVMLITSSDEKKGLEVRNGFFKEHGFNVSVETGYCDGLRISGNKSAALKCYAPLLNRNDLTPELLHDIQHGMQLVQEGHSHN